MPLPFVLDSNRTLNSVWEPVFILKPHGSGLDKRQATIQLCIRAEDTQLVRIALIFRGQGQRICDAERNIYRSLRHLLCVYFQPKAWADELFMLDWFDQFEVDTASLPGEKLLGADNHGAQQTEEFRRRARSARVQMCYTPPECTDCVSPCDHHVGARLKKMISDFYPE